MYLSAELVSGAVIHEVAWCPCVWDFARTSVASFDACFGFDDWVAVLISGRLKMQIVADGYLLHIYNESEFDEQVEKLNRRWRRWRRSSRGQKPERVIHGGCC